MTLVDAVVAPQRVPRMRRFAPVLAVAALAGAVAVVAVLTSRPHSGGPIGSGSAGVVVNAFPAGSTVTFGLQTLGNTSPDATIELISITPRTGDPSVQVLESPMLLGLERVQAMDAGSFDVQAGWPVPGLDPVPVRGATIPPDSRSVFEVVVPLVVPDVEQGIGRIDGFVIDYEANGRRYRDVTDMVLVICPLEDYSACTEFESTFQGP